MADFSVEKKPTQTLSGCDPLIASATSPRRDVQIKMHCCGYPTNHVNVFKSGTSLFCFFHFSIAEEHVLPFFLTHVHFSSQDVPSTVWSKWLHLRSLSHAPTPHPPSSLTIFNLFSLNANMSLDPLAQAVIYLYPTAVYSFVFQSSSYHFSFLVARSEKVSVFAFCRVFFSTSALCDTLPSTHGGLP